MTFVPENVKLKKCNVLKNHPKNNKYLIVNVIEKKLKPISEAEMKLKNSFQNEKQVILYAYDEEE